MSKHLFENRREKNVNKADFLVIIWKWTSINIWSDLEIGAHLLGWSGSLSYNRTGRPNDVSPDDW